MELMTIDIPYLLFMATIGVYMLLLVFILTRVYYDAEQRGLNGWMIAGMAFFTSTIFGTLAWLLLRPKMKPQPIPVRS